MTAKWCDRHSAPVDDACDESCVYTPLAVSTDVSMYDVYYKAKPTCGLCGCGIGHDTTGRPLCYGCGPAEMRPPLWTSPHHCGEGSACLGPCDPRSRFEVKQQTTNTMKPPEPPGGPRRGP